MKMMIKTDLDNEDLVKKFVTFCCNNLNVFPDQIIIEAEDELVGNGICLDIEKGYYLILVKTINRNITEIFSTIAHELVHVKQYEFDDLNAALQTDAEYETCWWETEAREKSKELIAEFVKIIEINH
jgi:hypothetical protein